MLVNGHLRLFAYTKMDESSFFGKGEAETHYKPKLNQNGTPNLGHCLGPVTHHYATSNFQKKRDINRRLNIYINSIRIKEGSLFEKIRLRVHGNNAELRTVIGGCRCNEKVDQICKDYLLVLTVFTSRIIIFNSLI